MKRRDFIRRSIGTALGLFRTGHPESRSLIQKSKIVISRDQQLLDHNKQADVSRLVRILDRAIVTLMDRDTSHEAWKQIVKPGEVIGLKINCLSGQGSTHRVLVDAVCDCLQSAGIRPGNIIVWDRFNADLERAGYPVRDREGQIRYLGNDRFGFENRLEMFGEAASLVSRIVTRMCDGIISLPVLRDHSIAGVTIAMKNMFGSIHNPNKYHLNTGDPYIPDVYCFPSIRHKIRLIICDAIEGQYEGGPSFMPHWRWPFQGLILGTDPAALDYTGWQIIEEARHLNHLPPLAEAGRLPSYIQTASDDIHRLGNTDPRLIETIRME